MKQEGRREFIMNEIVKYLLVVIPLLIILEGLLFLINKPKKDTGKREVRLSPLLAYILAPIAAGCIAAILWMKKEAVFRDFFFVLVILGILAVVCIGGVLSFFIWRIWYDTECITVRDLTGKKKTYYYTDITELSLDTSITVFFKNGKIEVDSMCRGKERFLRFVIRQYEIYNGGKDIPISQESKSSVRDALLVLAFAFIVFAVIAARMLLPASDLSTGSYSGKIKTVYLYGNEEYAYFYLHPDYSRRFVILNPQKSIEDFEGFIDEAENGTDFVIHAEEMKQDGDSYYQVFEIEDKEGGIYLAYEDANRQDWQKNRLKKAVLLLFGGVSLAGFVFCVYLILRPEKFPRLRRMLVRH